MPGWFGPRSAEPEVNGLNLVLIMGMVAMVAAIRDGLMLAEAEIIFRCGQDDDTFLAGWRGQGVRNDKR